MKKSHKNRLPDFSKMTVDQVADYWDTHDASQHWKDMEDVQVTFKQPVDRLVSLRLPDQDLKSIKRLAHRRGLGHTTLIRSWIREKLHAA